MTASIIHSCMTLGQVHDNLEKMVIEISADFWLQLKAKRLIFADPGTPWLIGYRADVHSPLSENFRCCLA